MIDHSIGPVWEANHVWLIFCLVVLWTAFPEAFESITLTLFVPLTIAALGIVIRGSSFAFRKAVFTTRDRRNFGAAFASSSVLVPYCMGAVAGAIASGRVPAGGRAGDPWDSWINPTSILGGILAIVRRGVPRRGVSRLGRTTARRRRRWSTTSAGARSAPRSSPAITALAGIFVLHADARYLFDGLASRALPVVIVSALCGTASLAFLVRRTYHLARLLAAGAVATVVIAWGVAQWPYLLPTSLEVSAGAAPDSTLQTVLLVFVLAAVIVLPSLGLLFTLDQKGLLPEEGGDTAAGTLGRDSG